VKNVLNEIKERLIENPDKIIELLEEFGFEHINHRGNEIRFARDGQGGSNISIRLKNNPYCCVSDWSRGVNTDIISYIIQEKNVTFRDVLQNTKKILGLGNDWRPQQRKSLFGGLYENLTSPNREVQLKTYDESVLDKYEMVGNLRFLRDGISLDAQRFWGIRFSIEDNAIIIPIYNEFGEIIGAKARINGEPQEGESKYYYPIPVAVSNTLYGYAANYQYLYGADTVYVGESEKFCQQLYTMGIRNCVSMGSHTLSEKQAKLLLQLSPKSITFMLDDGLDLIETKRNVDMIKSVSSMMQVEMYYFDHTECLELGPKDSPSDHGIVVWDEIVKNYIKNADELEDVI
jgi:hypothetical protein